MTDTSKLFELGQLAEASYANFSDTDDLRLKLLEGVDTKSLLTQSQANEFASHWQVASHQPDASSGFYAAEYIYETHGINKIGYRPWN